MSKARISSVGFHAILVHWFRPKHRVFFPPARSSIKSNQVFDQVTRDVEARTSHTTQRPKRHPSAPESNNAFWVALGLLGLSSLPLCLRRNEVNMLRRMPQARLSISEETQREANRSSSSTTTVNQNQHMPTRATGATPESQSRSEPSGKQQKQLWSFGLSLYYLFRFFSKEGALEVDSGPRYSSAQPTYQRIEQHGARC